MEFLLEIVGVGNQNINGINHIKYVENMDLNIETHGFDGKISKK
jgi:hypothetical protein